MTALDLWIRQKLIRYFSIEIAFLSVFLTAIAAVWLGGSAVGNSGSIFPLPMSLLYLIAVNNKNTARLWIPRFGVLVSAEQKYPWPLTVKDSALGRYHKSTLSTISYLANLYRTQDKLSEAEQMYIRLLAGYEKAPGHGCGSTLAVPNYLGKLYHH